MWWVYMGTSTVNIGAAVVSFFNDDLSAGRELITIALLFFILANQSHK